MKRMATSLESRVQLTWSGFYLRLIMLIEAEWNNIQVGSAGSSPACRQGLKPQRKRCFLTMIPEGGQTRKHVQTQTSYCRILPTLDHHV
jgi:hypothetical protein